MKKLRIVTVMASIVLFFATACANMVDEPEPEQVQSPKESSSSIKNVDKTKLCSISYASEFGTTPEKLIKNYAAKLTEQELFPVYAEKKTFYGWVDSTTNEPISVNYKVTKDIILTAQWRNIEVGDIVLAEGAIVSSDYYDMIKKHVHPMAIIYKNSNAVNWGISVTFNELSWTKKRINCDFRCLEKIKTGKDSYKILKAANPEAVSDSVFPVFAYAEHYAEAFSDVQNCPYTEGWYIPAEVELREAYEQLDKVNKSYAKIKKNAKLLKYYSEFNGAWTSNSLENAILGVCLVQWGNYTNMQENIKKINKNNAYMEGYYREPAHLNDGVDYTFFIWKMNKTKMLNTYCIREF